MARVFGSISDELMHKVDADALHKGHNRSEWLRNAIEAYLNNGSANNSMHDMQDYAELDQLRITLEQQNQKLILLKQKNEDLERLISAKDSEITSGI